MRKRVAMIVVLVAALVLGVMLPINTVATQAASMKLSKSKVTLTVGKTEKLSVKNLTKTSSVKWSTSNKKIATVSKAGKVTAKAAGSATITATVTAKSGKRSKLTCKVTVKAATVVNSKYRYVGVVYEGDYDLTISKVDKNGVPTEIIIFGEKIKLKNSRFEAGVWMTETEKGGYMEACFKDNYNKVEIKGNYGGEYKRTNRTDNEPIKTDKTIMKKSDYVIIKQDDTLYRIEIRYNKSNAYNLNKTIGNGNNKKYEQDSYSVTEVCKGDGWSFDCATCTLTLNNAKLYTIYTSTSCDITIKLIGENIICDDSPNMYAYCDSIGSFYSRDNVDKINVIFTGDGSATFCPAEGVEKYGDKQGISVSGNPLILKGGCTVVAKGRTTGLELDDMDITVGKNCTLKASGGKYGTAQYSESYSRKLTVDGTFIAEATGEEESATVFEGAKYSYEGGVQNKTPITPKLVIGDGNSVFAGSSEASAEQVDAASFTAARYIRIGKNN